MDEPASTVVVVGASAGGVEALTTLEDLERARRELETACEELQSTVEELETTNEELQSTNEELWGFRDDEVEGEHLLNLDIGIPVQRLRDPIRRVLDGSETEEIELDGHDRRGKPVHVTIAFAPLQNRREAEEPDGAILLVSAEPVG